MSGLFITLSSHCHTRRQPQQLLETPSFAVTSRSPTSVLSRCLTSRDRLALGHGCWAPRGSPRLGATAPAVAGRVGSAGGGEWATRGIEGPNMVERRASCGGEKERHVIFGVGAVDLNVLLWRCLHVCWGSPRA